MEISASLISVMELKVRERISAEAMVPEAAQDVLVVECSRNMRVWGEIEDDEVGGGVS